MESKDTNEGTIAIIGAGKVGGGLGATLCAAGFTVIFGVRAGKDISELLARCHGRARAAPPDEAARAAAIVVLAVPGGVAVEAARSLGAREGTIFVDCNNPVRWDSGPVWAPPPEGSLSAAIAAACPGARVVKAFNTYGAEFHADPGRAGAPVSTFLAGDDADAKQAVARVAATSGFDPIDVGPLRNAAALENAAILWIHLATVGGQGRDFALQLARRPG